MSPAGPRKREPARFTPGTGSCNKSVARQYYRRFMRNGQPQFGTEFFRRPAWTLVAPATGLLCRNRQDGAYDGNSEGRHR